MEINPEDASSILESYNPEYASFQIPETVVGAGFAGDDDESDDDERENQTWDTENLPLVEEVDEIIVAPPLRSSDGTLRTAPFSSSNRLAEITTSTRTLKVTHIDLLPKLSDAGVRGMVTNVSHGTFDSKPASLLVFSFSLRSGEHGFRFKNANIKITFSKHPSASLTEASPAVIKFAPRKVYGLPTVEGRKNRIGGEISLQVPAGPVTVGPSLSGEKESEYEKTHRFSAQGNFWSSAHGSDWDIVYWNIRENKRMKEGIPDQLNMGIVVEREGSFVATVEVTVDTPFVNSVFGTPWSKNQPALFVPGVPMGKQPRTNMFEELTEDEWRSMVPFDGEWENRFTGAAARGTETSKGLNFDPEFLETEESDDR